MMWAVRHIANRAGQNYPLLETQNQALYLRSRSWYSDTLWLSARLTTAPKQSKTAVDNIKTHPGTHTSCCHWHVLFEPEHGTWKCHGHIHHNQTYGTHLIVVICQDGHDPLCGPPHGALWRDLPKCAGDLTSMVRSWHSQLHHLAISRAMFAEVLFSFVVSVMHAHLLELLQEPSGAWAGFKLSVRNPQRGFT